MPTELYISNLSEDVWSFIQAMPDNKRQYEIDENSFLSDRDILTLPPNAKNIFVSPHPLDPDFLSYYQKLFATHHLDVWVPAHHTGEICRDLMDDKKLWTTLTQLAKQDDLIIKSYSASTVYIELVEKLKKINPRISTPESPTPKTSWTVNYFGSKSGFRQVASELQASDTPWLARGYISHGLTDTANLAASYYLTNSGVVLKTNKGHAGMGVEILHPGQLPSDFAACYAHFQQVLDREPYWTLFPVIVEAYMNIDNQIGGGNPNCEFLVTSSGEVKLLYVCGMRVSDEGVFKGIEIGQNVLPPNIVERLLLYGQKLGSAYAQAGYQGYFDVDCVYTHDQQLLMTESNVRRTGGTHVYHAALHLIGPDFMEHAYVLSNNTYPLPAGKFTTFKQVARTLTSILFDKKTGEGVIIAAANPLKQDKLSYIIIGHDQTAALAIEQTMEQLLHT